MKDDIEPPAKEPKIEYKMKCKYCGDIQILNKGFFDKFIEDGCDDECWGCMKRGYEPIIPEGLFVFSYENLIEAVQDHPCLEIVDEDPDDENRRCYTKSCPKWLDDICRNSTGCADCSTRTTEPPTRKLEIENAAEIENGPEIVHGGVTFESSDREPEKDDDCPHDRRGNEMFNGRPRTKCWDCDKWLEPDFDSDVKDRLDIGNNNCLCDKEPIVWVVEVGHGELNWICPDCKKIYGNWKPIWLRKEKDCWLCGGTGSVMMDRQTGAMFGKEPSIDWATKDYWERQCPNCGVGTESTIKIPEMVICPGRLDEKGKLRHVCKEDCSHSVPHEQRNACDVHNEPFCSPCIPVEPPDESNHFNSLDIEPPEEPEKEEAKWVKWPSIHDNLWVCSQCGQQMGAANEDQLLEKCSNCGASMDVK